MALVPIGDIGRLKDWAPDQDALDDGLLDRMLVAATTYIEKRTGRVIVSDGADITEIHDGDGGTIGGRESRKLFLKMAPVVAITSITENGVVLTSTAGYNTTQDVTINLTDGELFRRTRPSIPSGLLVSPPTSLTGWAPGNQNISIDYQPGYTLIPDDAPEDLKQACYEIAWWIYKHGERLGVASKSKQSGSRSYENEMRLAIPFASLVVDSYRTWRPV